MRFAVGSALCLLVLTCAQAAQAEVRYVSPSGSGTVCTSSIPCSLKVATGEAWENDEVILGAGDYSIGPAPIVVPHGAQNVFIHGDFSGPMPQIDAKVQGWSAIRFEDTGGRLSYLEIVNEAPEMAHAASCIFGGIVERVHLVARGPGAVGLLQGPGCLVRDSLLQADGERAIALRLTDSETGEEGDAHARNVTAIATGPNSIGVQVEHLKVGAVLLITLLLKNSIASGASYDLYATAPDVGFVKAVILVANSNFDTSGTNFPKGTLDPPAEITEDHGNQSAPPLFVDAAAGDFSEAAGSPTIDAGRPEEVLGFFTDLAGSPRILGQAPDIGAYEFVPVAGPPPPGRVLGRITSLRVKPKKFAAIEDGRGAEDGEKGAIVTYRLTAPARVRFRVERKSVGRIVKGKCLRKTRFNAYGKPCPIFLREKPSFSRGGRRGKNRFRFLGRLGSETLGPGIYRLIASAGGATRRAPFRVVENSAHGG